MPSLCTFTVIRLCCPDTPSRTQGHAVLWTWDLGTAISAAALSGIHTVSPSSQSSSLWLPLQLLMTPLFLLVMFDHSLKLMTH